jgi:hypothetical protein
VLRRPRESALGISVIGDDLAGTDKIIAGSIAALPRLTDVAADPHRHHATCLMAVLSPLGVRKRSPRFMTESLVDTRWAG